MVNQDIETLWPLASEVLQALGKHYLPAMESAASQLGLKGTGWGMWLLVANYLDPEPVSVQVLRIRAPYTSENLFAERLVNAAAKGYLTPATEGYYLLTERGKAATRQITRAAYDRLTQLTPVLPAKLAKLDGILQRLVAASLNATEPPGKWCLLHSTRTAPGADAHVLIRIDQNLTDLNAYRDDAHLAAWQPLVISAHGWDVLTFLWRNHACTLEDVYKELARRGHALSLTGEALKELVRRGWAEEHAGAFRMTRQGQEQRQIAEDLTNQYFFSPWECRQEEKADLHSLLSRLRDELQKKKPGVNSQVSV